MHRRQQSEETSVRAQNLRTLSPRRKPTSSVNGGTMRAPPTPCCGRRQRTDELCRVSRPTSDWPDCPHQRAQDPWFPSVLAHHPELHLVSWLHGDVVCRPPAERTPTWCRRPTELPGTGSSHPQQLQNVFAPGAKSKSRTSTLVITLPLACRRTRAAAVSRAKPRQPRTPTRAHAAR